MLVKQTLKGVQHSKNVTIEWKGLLMVHDLSYTHDWLAVMSKLDDLFFNAQLNSSFCGLL